MTTPVSKTPLFVVVFFIVGGVVVTALTPHALLGRWVLQSAPLHSALETLGALTAILLGSLLLTRQEDPKNLLLASGLVAMGILDGFHALVPPGDAFVFLRCTASLACGVCFALILLPQAALQQAQRCRNWIVGGAATASVLLAAWAVGMGGTLPTMVRDGRFTTTAVWINLAASALFLGASARLLLGFCRRGRADHCWFGSVALLLGCAGIMFRYSHIWDNTWWLWHFYRTAASLVMLGFLNREHIGVVSALKRAVESHEQTEQALRGSEEKYRLIADNANDWIYWITPDRQLRYISPSCERVTGYTPTEFTENSSLLVEIVHPEDREKIESHLAEAAKESGPHNMECRIITRTGQTRWISHSCAPVHTHEGRYAGRRGTNRDITERKRAEERLKRDAERVSALLELYLQAPQLTDEKLYDFALEKAVRLTDSEIGFLHRVADDQKTIILTTWNREALKNCTAVYDTPYPIENAGNWADCVRLGRPVVYNDFPQSPNQKGLPEGHTPVRRFMSIPVVEDGKVRLIFGVGNKSADYDEQDLAHIQLVANDLQKIFKQRTAEEALRKINEDLTRSNRELEQFAYVASHDLQEPLRMVASFTQLLGERYKGKLDKDADDFIRYAVDGANRLQALINDLLSFSRVTTRGKAFVPTDCEAALGTVHTNLLALIEETGTILAHDPLPTVLADETQMVQLFQNLIQNAIKFRRDEAPRIHVAARREGDEWIFSVRDNGIGIEAQYFDRIFVIFQRLHGKEEYPGTGIGLAVCKRIVERHGGRIWVESEPGKGSAFFFTLRGA